MRFADHSDLKGLHAFLSASKYSWVNYDPEKLDTTYRRSLAAQKGSILHEFASFAINLKQKQPRTRQTLPMFVNDAIGYKMQSEVVLFYSPNAFGTADAISFHKNVLRIHDLKTGVTPASFVQLEIYAALFCLEYRVKPTDIEISLRIYQNDEVIEHFPPAEDIINIMGKITAADKIIEAIKAEEL